MARRPIRRRSFGRRRARRVRQMQALGLPTQLHSVSTPVDGGSLRVLGSGDRAFQQILGRIREAQKSVEIRTRTFGPDHRLTLQSKAGLADVAFRRGRFEEAEKILVPLLADRKKVIGPDDPATMESRLVKGLYVAGEILDVDGPIGGFNFQAAFATGHAAGLAL